MEEIPTLKNEPQEAETIVIAERVDYDFMLPADFSEHAYRLEYTLRSAASGKVENLSYILMMILLGSIEFKVITKYGLDYALEPKRLITLLFVFAAFTALFALLKYVGKANNYCNFLITDGGIKFSDAWRFELHKRYFRPWNDIHSVQMEENIYHNKWVGPMFQKRSSVEQLKWSKDGRLDTNLMLQFDSTRASQLLEPLPPGSIVGGGKYEVTEILAAGGHAVTYKGETTETDKNLPSRTIALKEIVLPVAGGAQIRKRALENVKREAELLQKLDHEQIVSCFDVFSEGHKAYICLEYIDGFSLRKLIAETGPIEEARVLPLAGQMADILGDLHSQSPPLLHRDFTPDNLILKPDGKLVLIDFNVAEQREGFETSTVVGKHSYIPPEQFRGKATVQSDIYALGCTLHWLLTAEDPEPITASHPRQIKEEISSATDDLVARATAPDAQARFKSVAELLTHESLAELEMESPTS